MEHCSKMLFADATTPQRRASCWITCGALAYLREVLEKLSRISGRDDHLQGRFELLMRKTLLRGRRSSSSSTTTTAASSWACGFGSWSNTGGSWLRLWSTLKEKVEVSKQGGENNALCTESEYKMVGKIIKTPQNLAAHTPALDHPNPSP